MRKTETRYPIGPCTSKLDLYSEPKVPEKGTLSSVVQGFFRLAGIRKRLPHEESVGCVSLWELRIQSSGFSMRSFGVLTGVLITI